MSEHRQALLLEEMIIYDDLILQECLIVDNSF
jgi:hypothetical protein